VTVIESPGSLTPGTRAVLRTKVGPFAVEWVAEHAARPSRNPRSG